jgi:hypothetical protein
MVVWGISVQDAHDHVIGRVRKEVLRRGESFMISNIRDDTGNYCPEFNPYLTDGE